MADVNTGLPKKPIITEYLATTLIADTENRIIKLKKEMESIHPQLDEYRQAYEKLKSQYDIVKTRLEEEDTLLDFLSRSKNGIPDGVEFRVDRAESHNAMKPREQRKLVRAGVKKADRFPWTEYGIEILRAENKFLLADDLWEMVEIKYDIVKRIADLGKSFNSLKWGAINSCWMATTKSRNPQLVEVSGRLGLPEWVDAYGKIKPEYRRTTV
jgi:DNA mismatch repair ATPase MutS